MKEESPSNKNIEFAHAPSAKPSPWTWAFRIVRWSTYVAALITFILLFHKAAPPPVQANAEAAARAEEKLADVERSLSTGQPTTLHMDETELNSYLAAHLELKGSTSNISPPTSTPATSPQPSGNSSAAPTAEDVQKMRSNVRDVKVQLIDDRVKAYVVFNVYGKDLSLELEGHLNAQNGFLHFDPISAQLGAFPIPQSSIKNAFQRMMESPENREKLRLPDNIADLRIENGELVATYK